MKKLILLCGIIGVSFSSVIVRYSQAPSMVLALYRLMWTVLLMLPVVTTRQRAELVSTAPKDIAWCALSGVFLALHFTVWFESLSWTSVAASNVLVSTEVIFTALGFCLLLKGKLSPLAVVSIGLTFAGSVCIAMGDQGGQGALYGDALALLGAVLLCGYTLIGSRERARMSAGIYTFWVYLFCFLTLVVMHLITGTAMWGYGWKELALGLAMCVLCNFFGHSIFNWALKYFQPSFVSAARLGEAVVAAGMGVVLFHEAMTPMLAIGSVAVIGGVLLYGRAETLAARQTVEASKEA
ncbi:MAG: DMT family transporter [Eubacteriales bacterium]|jgi:drug/metabolite transporter (DMT)-like permease